MEDIFAEAGIVVDKDNRKAVDRRIHEIAGIEYKDCPQAWRRVKEMTGDDAGRRAFVEKLKAAE